MLLVHALVVGGMLMPGPSAPVLTASMDGSHPGWMAAVEADPVGDGIALGALVGAAGAFALTASAYARCGSGCEAPEPLPTYTVAVAMGAGIGIVGGLALTAVASRFIAAMLFGVPAYHVGTIAAAAALLVLVCAAAAYLPARRASLVDPLIALRYE